MNCMKCGQAISDEQAFCQDCLDGMQQHPVNPSTVVLLPKSVPLVRKAAPRRRASAEEQILLLKKKLWHCRVLAVILFIFLLLAAAVAYYAIDRLDVQKLWGQNYSTVLPEESGSTGTASTQISPAN